MNMRRVRGVTLVEMLTVVGVIALLIGAVGALSLQAARIYARTSGRIEPQSSEMLALKRMQSDIREAMFVITTSTSTWLKVYMPVVDAETGLYVIAQNPDTGRIGLSIGGEVNYFLGSKVSDPGNPNSWLAVPSDTGDTLFKADSSIVPVDGAYPNAEVIIDGILSTPVLPSPFSPGEDIPTSLFAYWPVNDNGTPDDPSDDTPTVNTQLIKITLTKPVVETTPSGREAAHHTMSTQFCLRNLQRSQ